MSKKWSRLLIGGAVILSLLMNSSLVLAGITYQVKAGDSLYSIAQQYHVSLADLRNANQIWTDMITIGQNLTIPVETTKALPRISYTEEDLDILARLVEAETSGEPYQGKVAAAAVTINRVLHSSYPDTLKEVIYQVVDGSFQYEPVLNGRINGQASTSSTQAAKEALWGADPTGGALGFYNPDKVREGNWVRQWPIITKIGNHVFFTHP